LSCLDKTEELLAGNVGARPVQHRDGGVLDGLEEQAAAALRMRKNLERRGQAQGEEEEDGKAKSRTSARRAVLKGGGRDVQSSASWLHLQPVPH
jgi:hypothetical protein